MLHENIHDAVVERLKNAYSQVRIGDPLEGELQLELDLTIQLSQFA